MSSPERREIKGLFPASFDPITIGHVSIAERAARTLDKLYVAVAVNPAKKYLFEMEEKTELVKASTDHIDNVEVLTIDRGATVDTARQLGAVTMIRATRSVTDFEDEIDLFAQNVAIQEARGIGPDHPEFVDTQTYYAFPKFNHVSSSFVRGIINIPEVEARKERIRPLVPNPVYAAILPRLPQES